MQKFIADRAAGKVPSSYAKNKKRDYTLVSMRNGHGRKRKMANTATLTSSIDNQRKVYLSSPRRLNRQVMAIRVEAEKLQEIFTMVMFSENECQKKCQQKVISNLLF